MNEQDYADAIFKLLWYHYGSDYATVGTLETEVLRDVKLDREQLMDLIKPRLEEIGYL